MTSGLAKGWSGFVWMLKILLPISLLTSLLAWSNWINSLDFLLEPVMGVVGLPPMAAIPLIAGLLTGIYGGIAAMASLTLTVDQMTLLAIFLLISHNLIQEGVIQSKSGLPFIKATLVRLVASIFTVLVVSRLIGHETATNALTDAPVIIQATFFSMIKTWTVTTLVLSGKMLVIVMMLMLILEFMKSYNLIDHVVSMMAPVLKVFGLRKQTGFLWITAAIFGLTYGAAVIVEEAKEGKFSEDELERLQLSIGINHSIIEDPVVFLSLGIGPFWLLVPRLAAAIIAVQLFIIIKKLISLPCFPKFLLWQKK
ncbi:MAG: iron transporter [Deltaproteobacteria bacterium]|nr:MAG: iron transporter [Deltaproteobacteria bacterium]RLC11595.1 MAG: iron transporter [Deltaproteobacteria bacterium]